MSEKVYIVVRLCVLMMPFLAIVMSHLTASELITLMALQAPLGQSGSIGQGSGGNVFGQKSNCIYHGCINGKCIPVLGLPGYHVCQCPPGHSLHPNNKLMCSPTDASMFETPGSRLTLFTMLSLIRRIQSMQSMQSNRQPSLTQSQPQNEAMFDA
ncbi:uncharacterized protein LOC124287158 [Haliotis rubra]|uniref:uncharacterized protein LOC124287158 n=1 Tax=Haliotis rubra TaxID=36100 RepID=UPI001EE4ED2B|nr:uncharacterized protein LOC124287158 [Haliotis rubra]